MIAARVVLLLAVALSVGAQSCNILPNTDFSSDGDLITVYGISSANECCSSCSSFEECTRFTYISANTSSLYQNCYLKSSNSAQLASTSTTGGTIDRSYNRSAQCLSIVANKTYTGPLLKTVNLLNGTSCCSLCANFIGCNYWSANATSCILMSSRGQVLDSNLTSGTVIPAAYNNIQKRVGKRGLGIYGTKSCSDMRMLTNVSWVYNWAANPGVLEQCYDELGIQYIPMVWGYGNLNATVQSLYTKSNYLFTFNEPNFSAESNLSPALAASAWPVIQAFADQYGMQIGAPSASYGGNNGDPIAWLDQFFGNCTNCRVDFINTHQYSCDYWSIIGVVRAFKKYNLPVWLTEFACYGSSPAADLSFVQSLIPMLEAESSLAKYSIFGSRDKPANWNLFNPKNCSLTAVGNYYANAPLNYTAPVSTTSSSSITTQATAQSSSSSTSSTSTLSSSADVSSSSAQSSSSTISTSSTASSTTTLQGTVSTTTTQLSSSSTSTSASTSNSASSSASTSTSASPSTIVESSSSVASISLTTGKASSAVALVPGFCSLWLVALLL